MTLKGDLDSISLADVFQTLSMTQQEGTLVVQNPEQRKQIFFTQQGVSLVTTGEKKRGKLGDLLVGLGKITTDQLTQALEFHKERGVRLGEALIELGYVTIEDIEHAVRQQIEEEIYDLFSWENASFEFLEGPPDDDGFGEEGLPITKLTFNVNALIMEAARRIDEWDLIEKFIPTMREIFVPDDALDMGALPEQEQKILYLLDGSRNVKEIVAESHVPKFDVCKFLYKLLEDGKARRVDFETLVAFGDDAVKNEDLDNAVKFYEQAVDAKVKKRSDQVKARMRLAQALEYANLKKEAAKHYKILAEQKLEEGDVESAISIWHKVIEFDPLDLENKERLINLYLENRGKLDANKSDMIQQIEFSLFKNGRSLAMAFSYAGQTERAKEVLRRLIELAPSNLELRKSLVNVHYDAGDKAGAIEELESIVQFLLATHDYDNLVEIYRNILKIDPARADVRKKIAMIEGGEVIQEKSRRWILKLVIALLVLVLLGGAGAVVWYQMDAMKKWEKVQADADVLWKRGEREKARQMLAGLKAKLPYTIVLKKIDQKIRDYDEIVKTEREKKEFALKARMDKANREFEDLNRTLHFSNAALDDPGLQRRIDDILATCSDNPYKGDLPNKLEKEKEWIAGELAKYRALYKRAMDLEERAKTTNQYDVYLPEAWAVWLRLFDEGKRVPSVWEKVRLPVRVETAPPEAQATVNGSRTYMTPFIHYKKPGESVSVKLRRLGYEDETAVFDVEDVKHAEPSSKHCFVRRQLTIKRLFPPYRLSGRLSTPPVTVGETLVLATIVSGKVFAFEIDFDARGRHRLGLRLNGLKPSGHPLNYGFDTLPAVKDSLLYLGCQDGKVYALASGTRWKAAKTYDTGTGEGSKLGIDGGGVALGGGKILVSTTQGLFVFAEGDGALQWRFTAGGRVLSRPLAHGDRVYFGCEDGHVYCCPLAPSVPAGGTVERPLWKIKLPSNITSEPVVWKDHLYVGAGDVLVELPIKTILPDKPDTWKLGGTPFSTGGTIRGKPVFRNDTAAFTSLDGYLYCVAVPGLEKVLWKFNAGTFRSSPKENVSAVIEVGSSFFLGNSGGRLFSVDAQTGGLNWYRELTGSINLPPVATATGVVFILSVEEEQLLVHGYKE